VPCEEPLLIGLKAVDMDTSLMSKQILLTTVLTLSIAGYSAIPTLAQVQQSTPSAQPSRDASLLKLPAQPSQAIAQSAQSTPSTQPSQLQPSNPSAQQSQSVPATPSSPSVQPTQPSIQPSPGTTPSTSFQPSQTVTPLTQLSPTAQPKGTTLLNPAQQTQSLPPTNPSAQATPAQPLGLPAQPIPETLPATPSIPVRRSAIIPPSSAITVTFCTPFEFDTRQKSGFPATVFLARPLLDNEGNIIAPVNSLVSAQLKPTGEGIEVKAEALVVGGRVIPIKTTTLSVPMLSSVRQESTSYYSYGQSNQGLVLGLANGLQNWLGSQGILPDGVSDVLDFGLSVASGVSTGLNNRRPKVTKTMKVPEKILFILTLSSPIALPPMTTQIALAAGGDESGPVCSEGTGGFSSGSYYRPPVPPAPNSGSVTPYPTSSDINE